MMNELKNKKILAVDDEPEILNIIKNVMDREGIYDVFTAKSCDEALEIIKKQNIALCILDVCLPDGDGFSLCGQIHKIREIPVLFLTAKGETDDRLLGLGLGADDYIVKPFVPKELLLRTMAVLKRVYCPVIPREDLCFLLGQRKVDLENAVVICQEQEYRLTAKEYILLKTLYENRNKIVTNDSLCMAAWGDYYYGYENTLMVHIRRLREKIEAAPSKPRYLTTIKGIGYKLVMPKHENEMR